MSKVEADRIRAGSNSGEQPGGLGCVRIIAECCGNASDVLERVRVAMQSISSADPVRWPSVDEWNLLLPKWLVESFRPEPSRQELDTMLKLPYEERIQWGESNWDLLSWLHWFQPENRYWSWWDAAVVDDDTLVVAIEVSEWPFPWGALKWLLKAAGASSVQAEN